MTESGSFPQPKNQPHPALVPYPTHPVLCAHGRVLGATCPHCMGLARLPALPAAAPTDSQAEAALKACDSQAEAALKACIEYSQAINEYEAANTDYRAKHDASMAANKLMDEKLKAAQAAEVKLLTLLGKKTKGPTPS